jgi:hypothetical protein
MSISDWMSLARAEHPGETDRTLKLGVEGILAGIRATKAGCCGTEDRTDEAGAEGRTSSVTTSNPGRQSPKAFNWCPELAGEGHMDEFGAAVAIDTSATTEQETTDTRSVAQFHSAAITGNDDNRRTVIARPTIGSFQMEGGVETLTAPSQMHQVAAEVKELLNRTRQSQRRCLKMYQVIVHNHEGQQRKTSETTILPAWSTGPPELHVFIKEKLLSPADHQFAMWKRGQRRTD